KDRHLSSVASGKPAAMGSDTKPATANATDRSNDHRASPANNASPANRALNTNLVPPSTPTFPRLPKASPEQRAPVSTRKAVGGVVNAGVAGVVTAVIAMGSQKRGAIGPIADPQPS